MHSKELVLLRQAMQQQHSVPQTAHRLLLLGGPWTPCPPHSQPLSVQHHSEHSDCLG